MFEGLSVAVSDPVTEALEAAEVEKIVLVARVVVTVSPLLLVKVETTSVVPTGMIVFETSVEALVIVLVTEEPSLLVKVVTEALPGPVTEPVLPPLPVGTAVTVAVGEEATEGF